MIQGGQQDDHKVSKGVGVKLKTKTETTESASRASIIRSVQTPLGFFSLVVLVCEAILGGLAIRASGRDFTFLVVGMLAIVVVLILSVLVITRGGRGLAAQPSSPPITQKYDVFLSSILAGFANDSRLLEEKKVALAIVECLEVLTYFLLPLSG